MQRREVQPCGLAAERDELAIEDDIAKFRTRVGDLGVPVGQVGAGPPEEGPGGATRRVGLPFPGSSTPLCEPTNISSKIAMTSERRDRNPC